MKLNLEIKNMSLNYAKDNVITKITDRSLNGENPINQDHLYTIVHSKVFDCNPHTKVKYKNDTKYMTKSATDGSTMIFVPTTATGRIEVPATKKVILDIRSFEGKGKILFDIFHNFISDFSVKATSALGENGMIYMTPSSISDAPISEVAKCPISSMTVLIDRYTLCELDEYCVMLLAYFHKHYNVKGEPHKMHKFLFKPIRIGAEGKKINICVPVLRLNY
jgi:hypothetical protein